MVVESQPDWRSIVEKHSLRVFRVAMRILGSVQDAEDVSQEVFVEAIRLHRSGPVQSWTGLFVRLTTLRAIDRLRKRKPTLSLQSDDRSYVSDPSDALCAKELAERLRLAVCKLPDQQATIFVMSHYEQMSHQEIADQLNISIESIATAIYKARKRLSTLLTLVHLGE